jgi:MFS family permease
MDCHLTQTRSSLEMCPQTDELTCLVEIYRYYNEEIPLDRRLVLFAVALLSTVAALAIAIAALPGHSALHFFAFLFGGTVLSIHSLSMALINDRLAAEHVVSASKGILQIFGIGAISGPVSAGIFMHWL